MSKYDRDEFEARKAAMLEEIRAVMDDVEALYSQGVEQGTEEIEELKSRLGGKLEAAKKKLRHFEEEASAARPTPKRNSVSLKTKRARKSSAAPSRPTKPCTKNRITPWALPRWQAW